MLKSNTPKLQADGFCSGVVVQTSALQCKGIFNGRTCSLLEPESHSAGQHVHVRYEPAQSQCGKCTAFTNDVPPPTQDQHSSSLRIIYPEQPTAFRVIRVPGSNLHKYGMCTYFKYVQFPAEAEDAFGTTFPFCGEMCRRRLQVRIKGSLALNMRKGSSVKAASRCPVRKTSAGGSSITAYEGVMSVHEHGRRETEVPHLKIRQL